MKLTRPQIETLEFLLNGWVDEKNLNGRIIYGLEKKKLIKRTSYGFDGKYQMIKVEITDAGKEQLK